MSPDYIPDSHASLFPWSVHDAAAASNQEFLTPLAICAALFGLHAIVYAAIFLSSPPPGRNGCWQLPRGASAVRNCDSLTDPLMAVFTLPSIMASLDIGGTFKVRAPGLGIYCCVADRFPPKPLASLLVIFHPGHWHRSSLLGDVLLIHG